MTRTVRYICGISGIAVAALLAASPATAATNRPARDEANRSPSMIERVEVPVAVPVDDTTSEAAQMIVAAAVGAAITAAAGGRRSRRRPARPGAGIIDITDTVRL
jgi:hypothetical protein